HVTPGACLRRLVHNRHFAPVDLVGREPVLPGRTDCLNRPPKVLINPVIRVSDRVTHVQGFAAALTHATVASRDRVSHARNGRQVLKAEDRQAHAAAPARRAASTTAAAFGGRSSSGTSWPPSPRARPNSCFR